MTQSKEKKKITITDLAQMMNQRFDQVDIGFQKIENRFDNILLITSGEFDKVKSAVASVGENLENKIEWTSADLKRDIAEVRAELKTDMSQIDKRLSKLEINPVLQNAIS